MSDYAHPEVLVSSEWLAEHLTDPEIRIVEVDVDTAAYDAGHIPGAVAWSWKTDLSDAVRRDITPWYQFESLLTRSGFSLKPLSSSMATTTIGSLRGLSGSSKFIATPTFVCLMADGRNGC